jgi:hypothetical protein
MLESSTERRFPVCICWRSENEFVDWFFFCVEIGEQEKELKEQRREE